MNKPIARMARCGQDLLGIACLAVFVLIVAAYYVCERAQLTLLRTFASKRYERFLRKKEKDAAEWRSKYPYHEM